jgi:hypothetical protein
MSQAEFRPGREQAAARPSGGLMFWRMQARGYPPGQAWFWETTWVYGIGLLGYGVYLLLVGVLSWLTGNLRIDLTLFHGLVWVFFLLAHLPDLLRAHDPAASTEEADARTPTPIRLWPLLPALLIAATNLAIALRSAEIQVLLARAVADRVPIPMAAFTQLTIVCSAYGIHGLVNLFTLVAFGGRRTSAAVSSPMVDPTPELQRHEVSVETPPSDPEPPVSAPGTDRHRRAPLLRPGRSRTAPGTLGLVVDQLSGMPEKELRPALRLMAAVAMGNAHPLTTPVLADTSNCLLCHRDGSLNGASLAKFLQHLPRIREFIPQSAAGAKVYRPIARKLQAALAGVAVPAWEALLTAKEPGLRHFAALLQAAPTDRPMVIVCPCDTDYVHSQALKKLLDHHLRRNALRHLVRVICGLLEPSGMAEPAVKDLMPRRTRAEVDSALADRGISEPDPVVRRLDADEIRAAAVILAWDDEAARVLRGRLSDWFPGDGTAPERVVPFTALDPARLAQVAQSGKRIPGPPPTRLWVRDAETTVAEKVLPVLQAKAGEYSRTFRSSGERFEAPSAQEARARVGVLRQSMEPLLVLSRSTPGSHPPERVLKLLWALAHRDETILIPHGLAPDLAELIDRNDPLDDGLLWACLLHAPYLEEVIPPNRARDYGPLARWLADCMARSAAKIAPATSGEGPSVRDHSR